MNILRLSTLSLITMMLIPLGAYAHCETPADHREGHPHCSNLPKPGGGGDTGGTYSAVISGTIVGGSNTAQLLGGKKGVGLSGLMSTPANITVDYFRNLFTASIDPEICFGPSPMAVFLRTLNVTKGKKGQAQATLRWEGLTGDGTAVKVLYALHMTGKFDDATKTAAWPPEIGKPKSMTMDTWLIHVEAQGDVVKSASCIHDGTDAPVFSVNIAITRDPE